MIKTTKRVEQATETFLLELYGADRMRNGSQRDVEDLVQAAFKLYAEAWPGRDIRQWKWPATELNNGRDFSGNQPWTVLFKRAVEIASINAREVQPCAS